MNLKKIVVRRITNIRYNADNLTVVVSYQQENNPLIVDLNGISKQTFTELALKGAVSICARRSDPWKAWAEVKKGNMSGKPQKPFKADVVILGEVLMMEDLEAVQKLWDSFSKGTKRKLRSHKSWRARKAVLGAVGHTDLDDYIKETIHADKETLPRTGKRTSQK